MESDPRQRNSMLVWIRIELRPAQHDVHTNCSFNEKMAK